jgi:hypothetical protein
MSRARRMRRLRRCLEEIDRVGYNRGIRYEKGAKNRTDEGASSDDLLRNYFSLDPSWFSFLPPSIDEPFPSFLSLSCPSYVSIPGPTSKSLVAFLATGLRKQNRMDPERASCKFRWCDRVFHLRFS